MNFSELNPKISGVSGTLETISMNCPLCNQRISIHARHDILPSGSVWKYAFEKDANALNAFQTITIEPSIQNHSIGKNWKPCNAHFTVSVGKVIIN